MKPTYRERADMTLEQLVTATAARRGESPADRLARVKALQKHYESLGVNGFVEQVRVRDSRTGRMR